MSAKAKVLSLIEPVPPWAAARAMLLEQLAAVCADAGMEHMTDYEDADASELEGLFARCDELVASALEAFEVVALLYGEDAPCDLRPSDPGGAGEDDSETWFNRDGVVDTTVVARMGLRMRHREVRNLPKGASRVDQLAAVGGTLRVIDGRLREWLQRSNTPETSFGSGTRLWQDLAAVVTLFLDVNKRQELVRHDGDLAVAVLRDLPTSPTAWTARTASEVRQRLAPMEGRCPVLDKFLRGGTLFELDQLQGALTNIIQVLHPELAVEQSSQDGPASGPRPVGQEWI